MLQYESESEYRRRQLLEAPRHPKYTREQLRNVARALGIPRGRNTKDTIKNLLDAGVTL